VKPDMITLAKSIGGGVPLAAFGASREVMDLIVQHKYFTRTYNTNRFAMAAGIATFREVLTRENYAHVGKLSKKLSDGYRAIVKENGVQAYVASAGVNGALMFYPQEIRNYRDWLNIDVDIWRQFWFAWSTAACLRCRTGGTSSGRFPCSIRKRTLTSISLLSKRSPQAWQRPSRNAARSSLAPQDTKESTV